MINTDFKNGLIALAIGLLLVSCGGGSSNQQQNGSASTETKTTAKASKLDVGERYAFAGLASKYIVPSFANEITEAVDVTEGMLIQADTYFGFGSNRDAFSDAQYIAYAKQLFAQIKAIADDGKVFKYSGLGSTVLDEEVSDPGNMVRINGGGDSFRFAYKFKGTWITINMKFGKSFYGKANDIFALTVFCQETIIE